MGSQVIPGLGCGGEAAGNISRLLTFLITLQSAALNGSKNESTFDPKTYVDLPLLHPLNETEGAFWSLPRNPADGRISNETLQKFVASYFGPLGSELVEYRPPDFSPSPPAFLLNVHNEEVRNWALEVHNIWQNLTRVERPFISSKPGQYSMVSLKKPFVVPGSRFREVYYWDSYWVVRGLIVSKMLSTARDVVDNLLSLVEAYGFVPNGARTYYLNRSQPPLLSEMVKALFEATGDLRLLEKALPILVKEHSFWTSAPHVVEIVDANNKLHTLSRYYAKWDTPRPESSTIDVEVAKGVEESKRRQLYNDIATTAETGWDFSSRWMEDRKNLTTLRTSRIVPADLNGFLFQMEKNIGMFAKILGDLETDRDFADKAVNRRASIEAILWNADMEQWTDYWLPVDFCKKEPVKFNRADQNRVLYASNFVPLWCGLLLRDRQGTRRVESIVRALKNSGLLQPAGIATSLIRTGQQWDYPNGWAPLQHMIIEGLYSTRSKSAKEVAEDMADRWLRTNFATFADTGAMQEKYDVSTCGTSGGGGEYEAQTGFGWSNGVVLALLDHFGWPESRNISCPTP